MLARPVGYGVAVPNKVNPPAEPAEPANTLSSPAELLAGFLDYYRESVLHKLDGLSDEELRTSPLPSGWLPLALLKHLAYVERRWLQWGFAAQEVDQPFGEFSADHTAWELAPEDTTESVTAYFHEQCARSREIVAGADLADGMGVSPRFPADSERPTLIWVLFHLLQEYARHTGHLDVARELLDDAKS